MIVRSPCLQRESRLDFAENAAGNAEYGLRFLQLGGVDCSGVTQLPCVIRKNVRLLQSRSQCAINRAAVLAQLLQVVGSPERPLVPRQESLEAFLGGLLAK